MRRDWKGQRQTHGETGSSGCRCPRTSAAPTVRPRAARRGARCTRAEASKRCLSSADVSASFLRPQHRGLDSRTSREADNLPLPPVVDVAAFGLDVAQQAAQRRRDEDLCVLVAEAGGDNCDVCVASCGRQRLHIISGLAEVAHACLGWTW